MSVSIQSLLVRGKHLENVSTSWKLEVELLLANALGRSREWLLIRPDQLLNESQLQVFELSFQRRSKGEPLAYILGKRAFWDFDLLVDRRVLIPRPETELLVECALKCLQGRESESLHLLDLGTGSGAIAIALARQSPNWHVTAVDISEKALQIAKANQETLEVTNMTLERSSWYAGLSGREFDLIVSNPPYIAPGDPHLQGDGLNFEPQLALVAEENGLSAIRHIVAGAGPHLKSAAWLLLEHGYDQRAKVEAIMARQGFENITRWKDLSNNDRVIGGRRTLEPENLPC